MAGGEICCCCFSGSSGGSGGGVGAGRRSRDVCIATLLAAALLACGAGVPLLILGAARQSTPELATGIALTACGVALAGGAAAAFAVRSGSGGGRGGRGVKSRVGDIETTSGSRQVRITVTHSRSEENLDRSIEAAILRLHLSRPRKSSLRVSPTELDSPQSVSSFGGSGADIGGRASSAAQQRRNHVRFSEDSDDDEAAASPVTSPPPPQPLPPQQLQAQEADDSVFFIQTADGPAEVGEWSRKLFQTESSADAGRQQQMEISAEQLLRRSQGDDVTPSTVAMAIEEIDESAVSDDSKKRKRRKRKSKRQQKLPDNVGEAEAVTTEAEDQAIV